MNQNGTMTFTEMEAAARRLAERKVQGDKRILSAIAPVLMEIYVGLDKNRAAVGPAD